MTCNSGVSQRYGDFEIQSEFCCAFTKMQAIWLLLGSYYKYWSYKCFNPYFLDQPVRIFVNGGKISNQYV